METAIKQPVSSFLTAQDYANQYMNKKNELRNALYKIVSNSSDIGQVLMNSWDKDERDGIINSVECIKGLAYITDDIMTAMKIAAAGYYQLTGKLLK